MAGARNGKLTPTEQRIYDVLKDGLAHRAQELRGLLLDDMAEEGTLAVHIHYLRTKLRPKGLDVMRLQPKQVSHYRLVRLLRLD